MGNVPFMIVGLSTNLLRDPGSFGRSMVRAYVPACASIDSILHASARKLGASARALAVIFCPALLFFGVSKELSFMRKILLPGITFCVKAAVPKEQQVDDHQSAHEEPPPNSIVWIACRLGKVKLSRPEAAGSESGSVLTALSTLLKYQKVIAGNPPE